jgi:hypothetical protein
MGVRSGWPADDVVREGRAIGAAGDAAHTTPFGRGRQPVKLTDMRDACGLPPACAAFS